MQFEPQQGEAAAGLVWGQQSWVLRAQPTGVCLAWLPAHPGAPRGSGAHASSHSQGQGESSCAKTRKQLRKRANEFDGKEAANLAWTPPESWGTSAEKPGPRSSGFSVGLPGLLMLGLISATVSRCTSGDSCGQVTSAVGAGATKPGSWMPQPLRSCMAGSASSLCEGDRAARLQPSGSTPGGGRLARECRETADAPSTLPTMASQGQACSSEMGGDGGESVETGRPGLDREPTRWTWKMGRCFPWLLSIGGPPRSRSCAEDLKANGVFGGDHGPSAVDFLPVPGASPLRVSGLRDGLANAFPLQMHFSSCAPGSACP